VQEHFLLIGACASVSNVYKQLINQYKVTITYTDSANSLQYLLVIDYEAWASCILVVASPTVVDLRAVYLFSVEIFVLTFDRPLISSSCGRYDTATFTNRLPSQLASFAFYVKTMSTTVQVVRNAYFLDLE
jgi:hypothetical protein